MKQVLKKQGIFLSIMVLFLIIGDLQIPYYLANPEGLKAIYSSIPVWYPAYALIGLASNVAIIMGMWRMKKWSAYLLIAYFASKFLVDLMYVLPEKQLLVFMTTVLGGAFWFWAIRRKWN
ncbi:MAG TPA: hypothetical protein VLH38_05305, partial [Patescibacteria group bacterium]|nr:hypothetical protein [Patescibacteria group bacterium]